MKVIESNNYQISIGDKSLTGFEVSDYSAIAILVDENTKKHCLPIFLEENTKLNNSIIIEIRSGEENKNIATCNYIWQQLKNHNFDRNSLQHGRDLTS